MRLLREIAELAVNDKEPLGNVLRKCMILNASLKNEELGIWIRRELNGYDDHDDLPDYRVMRTQAKGHFSGPMGASIENATLPSIVMEEEDRHWATTAYLMQPIASYDVIITSGKHTTSRLPWPQDLVVLYQTKFYRGYALAQAWQELPFSGVVSLCDTVRNRILEFALKVDDTLDGYGNDAGAVPPEKVSQFVTTIIQGNGNIVSGQARDVINNASNHVSQNDLEGLRRVLELVGVSEVDAQNLQAAIEADKSDTPRGQIGSRASVWLANMLVKAGNGGLNVGVDVAAAALTECIKGYIGL